MEPVSEPAFPPVGRAHVELEGDEEEEKEQNTQEVEGRGHEVQLVPVAMSHQVLRPSRLPSPTTPAPLNTGKPGQKQEDS